MLALIPALLSGWFKSALAFLRTIPWQAWVAIVLAVVMLFLYADARHYRKLAEQRSAIIAQAKVALQDEQQSHAVTRTSLNTALNRIAAQNEAVDRLGAESAKRIAASDAARKAAVSAAQRSEEHARALDASSAVVGPRDGPCVPSKAFLDLSGEL